LVLPTKTLATVLASHSKILHPAVDETLQMADLYPEHIGLVIYLGGASLMMTGSDTMKRLLPNAQHLFSELFTAVTDGLAIASGRR